jgi:hypothetical protein
LLYQILNNNKPTTTLLNQSINHANNNATA